MVVKAHRSATDSPKAEVGEIDTRAPFHSVKHAVSLFGEGAIAVDRAPMKRPKAFLTEQRILAKEMRLHMAQTELNKYKEQLENAEKTKAQALAELENAKRMIETLKLSKESAIEETEAAKNLSKKFEKRNTGNLSGNDSALEEELDSARSQYAIAAAEVDAAKLELVEIRQEFEITKVAKVSAFQKIAAAENMRDANRERADELTKEMAAVQESLVHLKLGLTQAQQEGAEILSEKDEQRQASKLAHQELEKKLDALRKEFDPEAAMNLREKLMETDAEIERLQKEVQNTRASESSMEAEKMELESAKRNLLNLLEEESSLRTSLDSLRDELERVKREHSELKEKEAEAENIAGDLHAKLQKSKAELDAVLAGELKTRATVDDWNSTLQQLSSEAENARIESEKLSKDAEGLKKEAEMSRVSLGEVERNLEVVLKEAEEAKAAEESALNQIRTLTEKTTAARSSTSESGAYITISTEEYESLSRKVDESNMLAEMKVAAAMAQVDAVKAGENEYLKRLEVTRKEIEDMETETKEALKRAEMSDAAKRAIDGELKRWREREEKRAAEAAARILSESEMSKEQPPLKWNRAEKVAPSPPRPKVMRPNLPVKGDDNCKMEKASILKKALLPNLSGIFSRKKKQIEFGSPSQLPSKQCA